MQDFIKAIKNNRILLLAAFSVLLCAILVANITTALFYSSSDTYSTIVISDLDVTAEFLNQTGGDLNITTETLLPGEVIERTLQISNGVDSLEAYVRIKAIFEIDRGSGYEEDLAVQMQLAATQTGWVQGNSGPQYWFYYDSTLASNTSITVDLDFIVFPTEGNDNYGLSNEDAGKPYRVTVTVNAIQVANNAYIGWSPDYPTGWPS